MKITNNKSFLLKSFLVLNAIFIIHLNASAASKCEQLFKIETININNPALETNRFNVKRDLKLYDVGCPFVKTKTISETVAFLAPGSRWVDMGAGQANAMVEGLKLNQVITGTAISYKKPDDIANAQGVSNRFKYLSGDYVENMYITGKLSHLVNKTDLITDLFGPLTYSENLPLLFQTYMDLLKKDGVLIFNLMEAVNYSGTIGKGDFKIHETDISSNPVIINGQIDQRGIVTWLKSIPGIVIEDFIDVKIGGSKIYEKSLAIKIIKINDYVYVPQNLKIEKYVPGGPPSREFSISN